MTLSACVTARLSNSKNSGNIDAELTNFTSRLYIEQSFSNLARRKLRTFLTTFGVVIGIGALVSMFAFGQGVQKNVTDKFKELELFNYVNILPATAQELSRPRPALSPSAALRVNSVEGTKKTLNRRQFWMTNSSSGWER